MNEQLLAQVLPFYTPPPPAWYDPLIAAPKKSAIWLWQALQGDFNEHPTTGQVVVDTAISMIPGVDQVCDARDLIANCRKVDANPYSIAAWFCLGLALIGCFPELGSLSKGCVKVMLLSARRQHWLAMGKGGTYSHIVDKMVVGLEEHLARPMVRKTLHKLNIANPYHYLAEQLSKLTAQLDARALVRVMTRSLNGLERPFSFLRRCLPNGMLQPLEAVWQLLVRTRDRAYQGLSHALKPLHEILEQLINRLRVEGDMAFRAAPGLNVHKLGGFRPNHELAMLRRHKPDWVDLNKEARYERLAKYSPEKYDDAIEKGWPDIRDSTPNKALKEKYNTFDESMRASEIVPGEVIYRIVDTKSYDNSICWMRKAEFEKLQSKSEWRRRYAVWKDWNEDGEFVTYTVPPGKPLKVWEGRTATQKKEGAPEFSLEGGAIQIVVDPTQLKKEFTGQRQKTGWGYGAEEGESIAFLGLPELETTNHWYQSKEP